VTRHRPLPTRLGSVLAVALAASAVAIVAPAARTARGLGLVLVGVALLWVASTATRRENSPITALLLTVLGVVAAVGGTVLGVVRVDALSVQLVLGSGLVGISLLGAGLAPVRTTDARHVVSAGVGALVVCVVLAGLLTDVGALALLGSMAAVVVAWDAGDHAISLGEHVGRRARTWPVELTHTGVTATYGVVVVAAATVVYEANVTDVPLVGLLLLLGGAVALLVALSD
jgi:hypothetical protein